MADRIIGLDIGTSAVRAAELVVSAGSRPIFENFGQVGIPVGSVVGGEVRDRAEVARAIRRLWHDGGFSHRKVVLGLAGLRAITREVDMPPIPPDELDDAVRFQADEVIPFPLDQTQISAKVMAQFTDAEGAPQLRVLMAAAHRELVDAAVAAARDADLEPIGIDLNTAALARALYDPTFNAGPEAIVSVGAGLTMVVVHQAGQLQFVRTIDIGGQSVTQSVAGALDLPVADAELAKRRLAEPGIHDSRAEDAVRSVVEELVGEVHNSVRFFSSLPGRGMPARLLVTGGGARTVGFMPRLQEGLEVPVLPASPLSMLDSRLPVSPEEAAAIDPVVAVSVGLTLPDPAGKAFNLLPKEVSAGYAAKRIYRALAAVGALLLVLIVAGTVWRILSVNHAQSQVTTLTSTLHTVNTVEIPHYNKVVQAKAEVSTLKSSYEPLVSFVPDWLAVLNQLATYMPATSVFSTLSLQTSTQSAAAAKSPGASSVIATGSGQVTVPSIAAYVHYGNTMATVPDITFAPASGSISSNGAITFPSTFSVNGDARSRQAQLFAKGGTS
ncbi:MAG: type IV pilus assembly protein PilM [Actinomycetota bacterium]|nr:type IV pilus assembly protein PilM [Actinomycetota bacterium]